MTSTSKDPGVEVHITDLHPDDLSGEMCPDCGKEMTNRALDFAGVCDNCIEVIEGEFDNQ